MPRKSRIDTAGALHHLIARGIERKRIFQNEFDRDDFLNRLSGLTRETDTRCFAWALTANHFHLLIKTGRVPVAQVMQRLLTGYAVSYISQAELSRRLNFYASAVTLSVMRGERSASEAGFSFL
jgi:putative transposase